MQLAFSVDLEPNQDGTLEGIRGAMEWYDGLVARGTVYATYRIADERPGLLSWLSGSHEVGVHVHPREFGHEHDQLAELDTGRQRELIGRTRRAVADAVGVDPGTVTTFRAGRHSASRETFGVLADLGFAVDASINVRYTDYLPTGLTERAAAFELDSGLLELPTTYVRPRLFSRPGLRVFPDRVLTATANTLRTDSPVCSGPRAMEAVLAGAGRTVSMYMHPYDATDHHDLENAGEPFRRRLSTLLDRRRDLQFVAAGDL